ncbi:sensor histidine kinase [Dysosmobacter sp.]|uniref:sensor histidine kinase n=1 Tax=Dysosmobacter sp. TaxID=2591382 RepID=UPI003FD6F846
MIRKLQLKFVAICMVLVTAVLSVVFGAVYMAMGQNIEALSRQVLQRVIDETATSSDMSRPDISINIGGDKVLLPYFTVVVQEQWDGTYVATVTAGTYANLNNTEELQDILTDCLSQNQAEGVVREYGLRYLRQDNRLFGYKNIAFVDMSMEQATLQKMMYSYLQIALAALLLLLGVSVVLSRWATRPVEKAWRQQRQFLSDASHELKTPLTVILSNAEMLQSAPLADKPARWADNIRSEAGRMKSLVEEMLTLARADNMVRTAVMAEVSLTDVAGDCALAFEPVAFEAGKPLTYDIAPDITVEGDAVKLRQLIGVLLDNAIKYGAAGGTITLSVQKTGSSARLTVANPGEPIPAQQLSRLFERFYRADASRGEQSGFGLGLPIASTIAAEHKGTLKAESDAVSTRFIFTMPVKK